MVLNMLKNTLTVALVALTLSAGVSGPVEARPLPRPSERATKETPYSNNAVRRQREIIRTIREIERTERPSGYQFKATGRRPKTQEER